MKDIIDYYEHPGRDYASRYERGQFYWAPFLYIPDTQEVVRYQKDLPTTTMDIRKFNPEYEKPDPVSGTKSDEFLAILKFKLRPVIIVSTLADPWKAYGKKAGEYYIIAPIYTTKDPTTGRYKYPLEFVKGAIEYRYNSVFYLPPDGDSYVKEAVVRLDMLSTLHRSWLVRPMPVRLTDDALSVLSGWLHYYLTGRISKGLNEELEAFRELLAEQS